MFGQKVYSFINISTFQLKKIVRLAPWFTMSNIPTQIVIRPKFNSNTVIREFSSVKANII